MKGRGVKRKKKKGSEQQEWRNKRQEKEEDGREGSVSATCVVSFVSCSRVGAPPFFCRCCWGPGFVRVPFWVCFHTLGPSTAVLGLAELGMLILGVAPKSGNSGSVRAAKRVRSWHAMRPASDAVMVARDSGRFSSVACLGAPFRLLLS